MSLFQAISDKKELSVKEMRKEFEAKIVIGNEQRVAYII